MTTAPLGSAAPGVSPHVDPVEQDTSLRALRAELERLNLRKAECEEEIARRQEDLRRGTKYTTATTSPYETVVSSTDEDSDDSSDYERTVSPCGATVPATTDLEELNAFQQRLADCKPLTSDERWALVDECYRVDVGDELDVIPNLKDEFYRMLSDFDRKMSDEFPRMVLARQVQLYRFMRTVRAAPPHLCDTALDVAWHWFYF